MKGSSLRIDHEANAAFYEKRGVRPEDILYESIMTVPPVITDFKQTLAKYTK